MSSNPKRPIAGSRAEEPRWLTTVAGAGGAKGNSPGGQTAEEDKDTLQSRAFARVLDVVSEGPIEGWVHPDNPMRDIYLDNTPIENPDSLGGWGQQHDGHTTNGSRILEIPHDLFPLGTNGKPKKSEIVGRWLVGDFIPWGTRVESVETKRKLTMSMAATGGTGSFNQDWKLGGTLNFKNFQFQFRNGTQGQGYMDGFPAAENTIAVSVQVTKRVNPGPWTHQFGDPNLDAIRIDMRYPILQKQDTTDGDIHGTFVRVRMLVNGQEIVSPEDGHVEGKSSGPYIRTFKLELANIAQQPGGGWTVQVQRDTDDSNSQALRNETWVDSYTEVIYGKLRYPNTAYVGLKMDSRHFSQIPVRGYKIKGLKVKIPSNYDPEARTYSPEPWDGTFKAGLSWTNNPAWCFYDMCINNRYGLGHFLIEASIDKWMLYTIGKYCDQNVPNGKGGWEPRFSCNLYIQKHEDAIKVLQDMAGIFRGMLCYINGAVTPVQDAPTDPSTYRMFSPANVVNGQFSYSGTGMRARHNVAVVSWSDLNDSGKVKQEYVEDHEGIAKAGGITQLEMTGFGCTSRGQARRIGLWAIYAEKLLTDTVTFITGTEGYFLKPGQLIQVQDPFRAGADFSGRLMAAASTNTRLFLDRAVVLLSGHAYVVSLLDPTTGLLVTKNVTEPATGPNGKSDIAVQNFGFTPGPDPDSIWQIADNTGAGPTSTLVPELFRVFSMVQKDEATIEITGLEYNQSLYGFVDFDHPLEEPPISILPGAEQTKPPVAPFFADTIQVIKPDHTLRQDLLLAWGKTPDHFLRSYCLRWRKDSGSWHSVPDIDVTELRIRDVGPGAYDLAVFAINTLGVWSNPLERSYTVPIPPTKITGIAGLEIFGGNVVIPGTSRVAFETRDAHFTWRGTAGTGNGPDFFLEGPLEADLPDVMARGFRIKIFNDDDELWAEDTASSEYTYTWARNVQQTEERYGPGTGPLRIFTIAVYVVFTDNTLSLPMRLEVENTRPPAPRNVTTAVGNGFLVWQWDIPGAPDIDHFSLYASLNYLDDDPDLKAEFHGTSGIYYTQPGGPWYYWLGTVDSFGNVSANVPQGPPPGGIVAPPIFNPQPGSYETPINVQITETTPGCSLSYALTNINQPATQWFTYPGGVGVPVAGHVTLHAQATQNIPPFETAITRGNYLCDGSQPPPPPPQPTGPGNDNWSQFFIIPSTRYANANIHGTTKGAGTEAGEPSVAPEGIGKTVWYRWNTVDAGIYIAFWAHTSNIIMEAFTGASVGGLTLIAKSDATGILWFRQAASTSYWIRIRPKTDPTGLGVDFAFLWWTATCATPNYDPVGGYYSFQFPVARMDCHISTATSNASLYWAFGRDPTTTDYDGQVNRQSEHMSLFDGKYDIRTIAALSGWLTSAVGKAFYHIEQMLGPPCAKPTFEPPHGTAVELFPIQVRVHCDDPEASIIRYAFNGQIPGRGGPGVSTANGHYVEIPHPCTLKAVAYTRGREESVMTYARYRLSGRLPAPTFTPGAGEFTTFPMNVVMCVPAQPGIKMRYTTDGTLPSKTAGILIDGDKGIVSLPTPGIQLQAISYGEGFGNSTVTSGVFTGKVPTPTHTPDGFYYDPGGTVPVTIIFDPPAVGVIVKMRYTTDGRTPSRTVGTEVATSPANITISGGYRELRSIAYVQADPTIPAGPSGPSGAGGYADSEVKLSVYDYRIILPPPAP